jgi:hypothetical protein
LPLHSYIDKKNARRYDDCLKYTVVSGKKALEHAGLSKDKHQEAFSKLDMARCGVLIGTGMGGLSVFQDGEPRGRAGRQEEAGGSCRGQRVRGASRRRAAAARAGRAGLGAAQLKQAAAALALLGGMEQRQASRRAPAARAPPALAPEGHRGVCGQGPAPPASAGASAPFQNINHTLTHPPTPHPPAPGVKSLVEKGYKKISPFFIPYAITNMGGALLAIDTGFMGPNYSISTACATANYAFVAAANHIRNGDADMIVAGGSEAPIIPVGLGGFVACRALSTRNDEPVKASRCGPGLHRRGGAGGLMRRQCCKASLGSAAPPPPPPPLLPPPPPSPRPPRPPPNAGPGTRTATAL